MNITTHDAPIRDRLQAVKAAIRTILVHVQPELEAEPRLRAAVDLAAKLDAMLFGLGAEMIPPEAATDPTGYMGGGFVAAIQEAITTNLRHAEEVFRKNAAGLTTRWTAIEDMPADALARLSRSADLIVAGGSPLSRHDTFRWCDPARAMLASGRPVLVVPPAGGKLSLDAIVVAWKDTRESRRALADSLPFLKCAEQVVVMEICSHQDAAAAEVRTIAVVEGLKRHGVAAWPKVVISSPERVTVELNIEAKAIDASLIVAGGYGHSRLGEWIFGGVTYDLLHSPERFVLLSH